MKKTLSKKVLTKQEMKAVTGGKAAQTNCGVKINGEWRRFSVPEGEGYALGEKYVANGWATNFCCDSCPPWD